MSSSTSTTNSKTVKRKVSTKTEKESIRWSEPMVEVKSVPRLVKKKSPVPKKKSITNSQTSISRGRTSKTKIGNIEGNKQAKKARSLQPKLKQQVEQPSTT